MPAGRPTKLTQEVSDKICQAIQGGNYRAIAAAHAEVTEETMSRWMARGKAAAKGIYYEFRQSVLKAEKLAEIRAVALIMQAASTDPKHAQWWLERKHHKRWGRKDKMTSEVSGPDGKAIEIKATDYRVAIAALAPRSVEDSEG